MKMPGFMIVASILLTGLFFTPPVAAQTGETTAQIKKASPTEVYYFHLTRRCMTCQTVEKVAREAVTEGFPEAMKNGDISFKSVNIEDKENKDLVKRLKVDGQSLLIVNGKEKTNLIDKGFMYAVNEPAKLKAEVRAVVEKYIK